MIHCFKCGGTHDGWDTATCRRLKTVGTAAPTPAIKPVLNDPGEPVLAKKAKDKVITGNVSGNAKRQADLKSKRIAVGLVRMEIWVNPDDMAAIKDYAKDLAGKRC